MLRRLLVLVLPLVAPWLVVLAVNAAPPAVPLVRSHLPHEPFAADHCTWACHDHGCRHRPVLPSSLTADDALFGDSIRALYRLGSHLSADRATGYGAANILVFCLVWPALMYGLWLLVWWQGGQLARARTGA